MVMDERDKNFVRIASDLRHASAEALRAACLDPVNREWLHRKAHDLDRAAERIEREADKRAGWVIFVDDRD
jgi:hypothetical protein